MIRFRKMCLQDQAKILKWRTSNAVSSRMFSDVPSSSTHQTDWFQYVNSDPTKRYWVFSFGSVDLGVINLASIDRLKVSATAGYYIGDERYLSLGSIVPLYLYNHSFFDLHLNKIYGEVLISNEPILRIHKLHGFEEVGVIKNRVFKNGEYQDVVTIKLMASKWKNLTRFHRYRFQENEGNL